MKILIVGLGSIAQKHIGSLKRIKPNAKIYALRSGYPKKATDGVIDLYSYEEVQKLDFNFAIISNPTAYHKDTIQRLTALNIPLFIEKPIFHQLDIEEEINQIEEKGIHTYTACNLRFLDSIAFLKKHIESQQPRINEINVYCGSYLPDWRSGSDFKTNYSAIPNLGGGVHLDLIHELDYIYWIFGKPKGIRRTLKNNSSLNIKSFDYANYLLEYKEFCANITLNYFRHDAKRTFEMVFEDETWEVNLLKNTIYSGEKNIFASKQTISETYYWQMKYFLDNIKSKEIMNSAKEAFEVLKICLKDEA